MAISKENKFHYFVKDQSSKAFASIEIECYMSIPQRNGEIQFKKIEDLRLFFSTDIENYEVGIFEIHFGRNDCFHSGYKKEKELYAWMQSDRDICKFSSVSKEEYLLMREKAFKIFLEHKCTDYSKLEIGCEFPR